MALPTRRPHKKSRHGCQQCKKNRTKCDEGKPSCGRCVRTGAKCSLLDPNSALIIINNTSNKVRQDISGNTSSLSPESAVTTASNFTSHGDEDTTIRVEPRLQHVPSSNAELYRMRLLIYYNLHVAQSIGDLTTGTPEGQAIWKISVPELALKYDFLLHGILSISALHMELTSPSVQRQNHILAVEHNTIAMSLFNPHLANITADNIDALFASACLTGLYSFGIHLQGESKLTPLSKIHEVFTLIRGTGIIVDSGEQWLQEGIWWPWFRPEMMDDHPERLPDEQEDVIQRLTDRIDSTISTSSQRDMYSAAIEALRKNFLFANALPRTQMSVVMLPIMSPPEFLSMVCLMEPLALAILANWAAILHWFREKIWLSTWGAQTVEAVRDVLPLDWYDCISFAMKETGLSNQLQS